MFCPKCAAQNQDGAKFCRACGTDISLVPQALTGTLPEARAVGYDVEGKPYDAHGRRIRRQDTPSLDEGIKHAFIGIGFLFVTLALAFSRMGRGWWFWMLIPAFTMIGKGVAEIIRARQARGAQHSVPQPFIPAPTAVPPATRANPLPPRNTAELMPTPPSVTEGTTRHLGAEAAPKRFATPAEERNKK